MKRLNLIFSLILPMALLVNCGGGDNSGTPQWYTLIKLDFKNKSPDYSRVKIVIYAERNGVEKNSGVIDFQSYNGQVKQLASSFAFDSYGPTYTWIEAKIVDESTNPASPQCFWNSSVQNSVFGFNSSSGCSSNAKSEFSISYIATDENHATEYTLPVLTVDPLGVITMALLKSGPAVFPRFIVNSDGTVLDKDTNKMWSKCAVGQDYNFNCSGTAVLSQWASANATCANSTFAGYSDWRLPAYYDLADIVYCSNGATPSSWYERCSDVSYVFDVPTIKTQFFPNTIQGFYWSSTEVYSGITSGGISVYSHFIADFSRGYLAYIPSHWYANTRCVRN